MAKLKRLIPLLVVAAGVLWLVIWLSRTGERVAETPVRVAGIEHAGDGLWLVPKEAVGQGRGRPHVLRLRHLRAEQVEVEVAREADGRLLVEGGGLRSGDLLVLRPTGVADGEALAPMAGVEDERLVGLVLEAGMAAVAAESLPESVRYISPGYRDGWGYNIALMRQLLKRTYDEFDEPRIELAEPPVVRIEDNRAVVQADIWLTASFHGRRNYLLGDGGAPNRVMLRLDKAAYGWKLSRIEGLRPLGFEEKFLRLLGGEIGLPLSEAERQEKKDACMRCRQQMRERFGVAPGSIDSHRPAP